MKGNRRLSSWSCIVKNQLPGILKADGYKIISLPHSGREREMFVFLPLPSCPNPLYSSFTLSSSAALTTTNTEPQLCQSAPVTGLSTPRADNTTAVRLMTREAAMLT